MYAVNQHYSDGIINRNNKISTTFNLTSIRKYCYETEEAQQY